MRIQRIDIRRQLALAQQVIKHILVCGEYGVGGHTQAPRHLLQQPRRVCGSRRITTRLISKKSAIAPDGLAVFAPKAVQRPTRQLFAGVPLALTEMRKPKRRVALLERAEQFRRDFSFVLTERLGVPFRRLRILDRDESGFAAHGQTHILALQGRIDLLPQRIDRAPLRFRIGFGNARRLPHALDFHRIFETGLAFVHRAG